VSYWATRQALAVNCPLPPADLGHGRGARNTTTFNQCRRITVSKATIPRTDINPASTRANELGMPGYSALQSFTCRRCCNVANNKEINPKNDYRDVKFGLADHAVLFVTSLDLKEFVN
jgi:hypothetical protein